MPCVNRHSPTTPPQSTQQLCISLGGSSRSKLKNVRHVTALQDASRITADRSQVTRGDAGSQSFAAARLVCFEQSSVLHKQTSVLHRVTKEGGGSRKPKGWFATGKQKAPFSQPRRHSSRGPGRPGRQDDVYSRGPERSIVHQYSSHSAHFYPSLRLCSTSPIHLNVNDLGELLDI